MKKALLLASVAGMIEAFNQDNISILQKDGYEVHVMANFSSLDHKRNVKSEKFMNKLNKQQVKVYDLPIQRSPFERKNMLVYREIKEIFKTEKYDLIHCHTPIGGVLGRLASRGTKQFGTKVIYTAHGFHFYKGAPKKNWILYYTIEKLLSYWTDYLITINPEDYMIAKSRNFKSKNIVMINGVGVNLNKFSSATSEKKNHLRKKYGFPEDDILLIYVGELSNRKNQTQAIKMMNLVIKKVPQAKLLLVGDGDQRNHYLELIQTLNLADHVSLLGYRSDIPELMNLSDISISTSRQEGLPVNVMEAMATGLPLVVTDCRGNRDLVHNAINGFVVSIDDHESMARVICKLAQNKLLRNAFGARNKYFIAPYEIKNVNPQMSAIYNSCINENANSIHSPQSTT